jgi:uncharacterized membrane protein YcaP (DUF421 family)
MDNLHFTWESLILAFSGMVLLRISGRKSISQMTIAQTIIMISIGSIIIQPIVERSVWKTVVAAAIFIVFLIITEFVQVHFNFLEKLITGKSLVVIQDGKIVKENLKKLRFTVDQLEMRLRQQGIARISDLKTGTLEPNGQLGFEYAYHAKPVTMGDLEKFMGYVLSNQNQPPAYQPDNVFDEIRKNTAHNQSPDELK